MKKNRTFPIIFVIIILISVIYGAIVMSQSISMRSQKMSEVTYNEQEIEKLQREIEELKLEIDNSDSMEFIEKVAREEFGMVKPREVIYIDKNKSSEKE